MLYCSYFNEFKKIFLYFLRYPIQKVIIWKIYSVKNCLINNSLISLSRIYISRGDE